MTRRLSPLKNPEAVSQSQTALEIDTHNVRGSLSSAKFLLRKKQREMELLPFWKSFSTIAAISSSLVVVIVTLLGTLYRFEELPPEAPYFFDSNINTWQVADKSVLFVVPVVYSILVVMIMRTIYQVFGPDKRLALIANWILTFMNILTIFAIAELSKLVL